MVDRLRALPGAVDAAASSMLPLDGRTEQWGGVHCIEGRPRAEGEVPPVFAVRVVSPDYFDAMRIALVGGRVFDRLDEEHPARPSNATRSASAPCSRFASATSARTTPSRSARTPAAGGA